MSLIAINDMHFYAHHGCFEEERAIGTHFRVDLQMEVDTMKAQHTDCIDDTVNYLAVYQTVRREMEIPSKLLEHVGERIAAAVIENYGRVKEVRVKVSKLNPPLGGHIGGVSVEISKERRKRT